MATSARRVLAPRAQSGSRASPRPTPTPSPPSSTTQPYTHDAPKTSMVGTSSRPAGILRNGHVQLVTCRGDSQHVRQLSFAQERHGMRNDAQWGLYPCRWQTFNLHAQLANLANPPTARTSHDPFFYSLADGVMGVVGWPRTLRAGTAAPGNLQITNLCFAIFSRPRQCFHTPPKRLSLTFLFFHSATLSSALVLLQAAGDTSPAARRHDKVPRGRSNQTSSATTHSSWQHHLRWATHSSGHKRLIWAVVFVKGGTCTDDRSCP